MSGGSLNYFYSDLECHVGDFGDRELDDLVRDLAKLFHDREWFLSCDTSEGNWKEARDAFKKKWFGENARAARIVKYMNDIRDEVLEQFGISNKYCNTCQSWTQDDRDNYSEYGKCDFEKHCLTHRSDSCEKYERRNDTDGEKR